MNKTTKRLFGLGLLFGSMWVGFYVASLWESGVYEWYKLPTLTTFGAVGMWGGCLFGDTIRDNDR